MNYQEIQKIWDDKSQSNMYVINQKVMDNIIISKSKRVNNGIDKSEKLLIAMNILIPVCLILFSIYENKIEWPTSIMSLFMLMTSIYIFTKRSQRIKSNVNWSNNLIGTLDRAINNAKYQMNMLKKMGLWYILGVAFISILALISEGKALWIIIMFSLFFIATFFLTKLERRILTDKQYNDLIHLKENLIK